MSEVVFPTLFWLPRLPAPDMSPKPQPTPCDQRKELALRRTGEIHLVVCVCDVGSYLKVKAVKGTGDFPLQVCSVAVHSV